MRQRSIVSALVTLAAALTLTGDLAAQPVVTVAEMRAHPADPREPGPDDFSVLIRNADGVAMHLETSNLDVAAYTAWWVIFNFPEFCQTTPCTPADAPDMGGDPAVQFSEALADGLIVRADGRARSDSGLAVGELKDVIEGPGLLDPFGAEIFLAIRTHGPLLLDQAHLQLSTLSGGCPPNDCVDQQMSIHLP